MSNAIREQHPRVTAAFDELVTRRKRGELTDEDVVVGILECAKRIERELADAQHRISDSMLSGPEVKEAEAFIGMRLVDVPQLKGAVVSGKLWLRYDEAMEQLNSDLRSAKASVAELQRIARVSDAYAGECVKALEAIESEAWTAMVARHDDADGWYEDAKRIHTVAQAALAKGAALSKNTTEPSYPEGFTPTDAKLVKDANEQFAAENQRLRQALRHYANGDHLMFEGPESLKWESVSGEPPNLLIRETDDDSEGWVMVEDGSIAKMALQGKPIDWDGDEPKPVEGEAEYEIEKLAEAEKAVLGVGGAPDGYALVPVTINEVQADCVGMPPAAYARVIGVARLYSAVATSRVSGNSQLTAPAPEGYVLVPTSISEVQADVIGMPPAAYARVINVARLYSSAATAFCGTVERTDK